MGRKHELHNLRARLNWWHLDYLIGKDKYKFLSKKVGHFLQSHPFTGFYLVVANVMTFIGFVVSGMYLAGLFVREIWGHRTYNEIFYGKTMVGQVSSYKDKYE